MAEKNTRISKRLREAIRLMVEEGLTRAKAAETAGMTDHAVYCALRKPHVRALRREFVGALRESAASRTIARAEQLADGAESEHVRNDANKFLASLDVDTSPVQRSEQTVTHRNLGPGLVIVISGDERPSLDVTPAVPHFVSREKHLSKPVPHPAWRNRESDDE